ncbi:MAG: transposase [Chlamydiales bacterium]|jgi:transposase
MDETSKQQVKEVREPLPMEPGKPERFDTEYERNGVSNLFIFFSPLEGKHHISVTDTRKSADWALKIKYLVDNQYKDAEKIMLVMDNLNIHHPSSLYKTFKPEEARRIAERLEIHYTPKHGSWLNMAEIELSILSRQCLDRRISDQETMKKEVAMWEEGRNSKESKMDWRFTTEDARIQLKRLYPKI